MDDADASRRGRGCPWPPNIMAPRQSGLTLTPVVPSERYLMCSSPWCATSGQSASERGTLHGGEPPVKATDDSSALGAARVLPVQPCPSAHPLERRSSASWPGSTSGHRRQPQHLPRPLVLGIRDVQDEEGVIAQAVDVALGDAPRRSEPGSHASSGHSARALHPTRSGRACRRRRRSRRRTARPGRGRRRRGRCTARWVARRASSVGAVGHRQPHGVARRVDAGLRVEAHEAAVALIVDRHW